jgi:hypothetical protein
MSTRSTGVVRVRLLRKLADRLDGIDVSGYDEGDVLDLPRAQAQLLIAERWALPFHGARPSREMRATSAPHQRTVAADRLQRRTLEQLRRVGEEMDAKRWGQQERRRAEDRIRDELHDSRSNSLND